MTKPPGAAPSDRAPSDLGVTAYLGLGSNLGDREANLRLAMEMLGRHGRVTRVSSLYETAPWGYVDQPRFLNAACALQTRLAPHALLDAVKRIEREMGRVPTFHLGPRLIDIDILLYGNKVVHEGGLVVPHASMHERAFVLVPLAEIAPDAVHPALGKTVRQLLEAMSSGTEVRRILDTGPPG